MFYQQPSELPQPEPSRPDQQFGEYTLQYFIEDNFWYILGVLAILIIVIGYSLYVRRKKSKKAEN